MSGYWWGLLTIPALAVAVLGLVGLVMLSRKVAPWVWEKLNLGSTTDREKKALFGAYLAAADRVVIFNVLGHTVALAVGGTNDNVRRRGFNALSRIWIDERRAPMPEFGDPH